MIEALAPRRVALDPCIRVPSRPSAPSVVTPAHDLSPEQRNAVDVAIAGAFEAIVARLETPAEAWTDDRLERRYVRLWGVVDISVSWFGTEMRAETPHGQPLPKNVRISLDLSAPVAKWAWTEVVTWALSHHFHGTGITSATPYGPGARYLRRALVKTFEHYVDWPRLRRLVLGRLHPHALCVSLAHRVFGRAGSTVEAFNWTARNRDELALMAIEHPRLLPFMRLMTWRDGSLRRTFDGHLKMFRIDPAARRKLEMWGYGPFESALEASRSADAFRDVARVANLFDAIGVGESPPDVYGAMAGTALARGAPQWFQRALWNEVASLREDDPSLDPIPGDFEEALDWVPARPDVDANQRRAGWRWISRQVLEREMAREVADCTEWPTPCGSRAIDGLAVVPLRSARDLCEEGIHMRNCIAGFADECRGGRVAAFSIRQRGRRLACFTLERDGDASWKVSEIAGKANCAVPELVDIPTKLARELSAGR